MSSDTIFDKQWSDVDIDRASKEYDPALKYLPSDISSVLDLGGGVGAMRESLARSHLSTATYCLLDSSKAGVERANSRGVRAVLHDLESGTLPFPDNTFDCVCLIDVLEHLRDPWIVLREAKRVSKKYVFVHGPNFAYWRSRLEVLRGLPNGQMVADRYGAVVNSRGQQSGHIYYMTYKNLVYWGKKCGLAIDKQRVFWYRRYTPFRWFLEPLFRNFGSQYQVLFKKKCDI